MVYIVAGFIGGIGGAAIAAIICALMDRWR